MSGIVHLGLRRGCADRGLRRQYIPALVNQRWTAQEMRMIGYATLGTNDLPRAALTMTVQAGFSERP